MKHYRNPSTAYFQLIELLHYVELSDVVNNAVPLHKEIKYAEQLYRENYEQMKKDRSYPDPRETFQEHIEGDPCKHCKSKNTVSWSQQIRSRDEPMTDFTQCNDCGKTYKS